jgi:peptidoglycan/LPS O-acetylase OafA/YrhL
MMATAAVQEGRVFHTLDALRGIAAIGVVVYHLQRAFTPISAPGGYLAVELAWVRSTSCGRG